MTTSAQAHELIQRTARGDTCEIDLIHPEAVRRAQAALPPADVTYRVAAIFQVLADPTRARIVYALGHEEFCVRFVAAGLSISVAAHAQAAASLGHRELPQRRPLAYYRSSSPILQPRRGRREPCPAKLTFFTLFFEGCSTMMIDTWDANHDAGMPQVQAFVEWLSHR